MTRNGAVADAVNAVKWYSGTTAMLAKEYVNMLGSVSRSCFSCLLLIKVNAPPYNAGLASNVENTTDESSYDCTLHVNWLSIALYTDKYDANVKMKAVELRIGVGNVLYAARAYCPLLHMATLMSFVTTVSRMKSGSTAKPRRRAIWFTVCE